MDKALAIGVGAALAAASMGLTGCITSYEGTGSKTAASAEQLAMTLDDPWDAEQSVTNASMSGNYQDGTYTGRGIGMDGWITVTLSISGNRLSVVSIRQEGETQSVGGYEGIRDGVYARQIDAAQGTQIDGVSGATITTAGVTTALENAIDQAKA
jgi:uncharacterized protein with FMN-binding domain